MPVDYIEHRRASDTLWHLIEREAKGRSGDPDDAEQTPTVAGVIYAGSTWRPATTNRITAQYLRDTANDTSTSSLLRHVVQ